MLRGPVCCFWIIAIAWLAPGATRGEAQSQTATPIPVNATALEGLPQVRIETTQDGATRRELTGPEAAQSRLVIKIVDGDFYWTGREGRPLSVTTSGDFTYLSSREPGRYVRFRQLNDLTSKIEHGSVQCFDLRIFIIWLSQGFYCSIEKGLFRRHTEQFNTLYPLNRNMKRLLNRDHPFDNS